jgi:hypothetical protein
MSMTLAERQEILAIGWMANGSPIFPIWGCDPGDDEGGEVTAGGDEGGGEVTDVTEVGPGNPAELVTQIETLTRRLLAADRSKGELDKKLREYETQGQSELERANATVAELTEKLEATEQRATRATLEREVLKHPGYVWHDPEVALALIDLTGVEFDDETGKVRGVADALKRLAASKPFLLKGKNLDGGGQGGQQGQAGQKVGASGTNTGSRSPDEASKKRADLVAKYKL